MVMDASVSVSCSGPGENSLHSSTNFNTTNLSAGNFAAQMTALAALASAVGGLTHGIVRQAGILAAQPGSNNYPVTPANRGSKWIITATNSAGDIFTYTIPAALATSGTGGTLQADGVSADLTSTPWAAFKTAFEAFATDPAGNSLTLVKAKWGGRRR